MSHTHARALQIIKVTGIVNGMPDFQQHGQVVNGASDMLFDIFGVRLNAHAHIRTKTHTRTHMYTHRHRHTHTHTHTHIHTCIHTQRSSPSTVH
jgi:hypothetical protein